MALRPATHQLGNITTFHYDAYGRQVATIDTLSHRSTTVFDSYNRVSAQIDQLGNITTFLYDSHGRQETVVDPTGERTTAVFDNYGRQVASIDPLSNITTTVYDSYGRVVATMDPLSHLSTTVFDTYGRVVAQVDGDGNRTTTVFDAYGRQQNLIDASNNKTTFVYDALNRVIQQTDPNNHSVTYAYDAIGRENSTTDRLGRRRDFGFDAGGRKTTETWIASDGSTVENRITFTYDNAGRTLTAADSDGTYTFTYDAKGQIATVGDLWGNLLTFTYNAAGQRTKVEDSQGGVTTSVYDDKGQLTQRDFSDGTTSLRVDFTYNERGQIEHITRYANLAGTVTVAGTTYTYDDAGNVANILSKDGSNNVLSNLTYTYDAASRLTNENDGTPLTFTYDSANQVTADGSTTVTYDATGNRATVVNGTGTVTYTTATGNQLSSDGAWNYTYDAEGNMTKKVLSADGTAWTYGYDHWNHLTVAKHWTEDPGPYGTAVLNLQADYKYDALGNRIEKDVDADGSGAGGTTTTRYAVDGWNPSKPAANGQENVDTWATFNGGGTMTTRFLEGDGVDEHLARVEGSNAYWYLTDHLNSIRTVLNSSGAAVDQIEYDAFGNITSETAPTNRSLYAYTGRELDVETQLQFNRARYYDASTARWITQDPLGFDAGDSNLYRYVMNRVNNDSDPSGLQSPSSPGEFFTSFSEQEEKNVKNKAPQEIDIDGFFVDRSEFRRNVEQLQRTVSSISVELSKVAKDIQKLEDRNNALYLALNEQRNRGKLGIPLQPLEAPNVRVNDYDEYIKYAKKQLDLLNSFTNAVYGISYSKFVETYHPGKKQIDMRPNADELARRLNEINSPRVREDPRQAGVMRDHNVIPHTNPMVLPGSRHTTLGRQSEETQEQEVADILRREISALERRYAQAARQLNNNYRERADISRQIQENEKKLQSNPYGINTVDRVITFVPVIGTLAATLDAIIAGDTRGAIINAVFLGLDIVTLPSLLGTAVRASGQTVRYFNQTIRLTNQAARDAQVSVLRQYARDLGRAAGAGGTNVGGIQATGQAYLRTATVESLQIADGLLVATGRAAVAGARDEAGRWGLQLAFENSCFVAGTPLLTPDGEKPIEQFQVGDEILSRSEYDPEGPVAIKVVEKTFVRVSPIIALRVGGRQICTTAEHPFYVEDKGWVCAREIATGDRLSSHDGQWVTVEAVTDLNESATVYNLRVSEYHTYFVGNREWGFSVWAHNANYIIVPLDGGYALAQVQRSGTVRLVREFENPNRIRIFSSTGRARRAVSSGGGTVVQMPSFHAGYPTAPGGTAAAYNSTTGQGIYVLREGGPTGRILYVGRGDAPSEIARYTAHGGRHEGLYGQVVFNNNLSAVHAQSLENELINGLGGARRLNPGTPLRNINSGIGASSNSGFVTLEFAADDGLLIEALSRLGPIPR